MIVFVRTKNETETLAEKLRARGFSATAINGDIAQEQRERTVDQLEVGKLDILVATDVAARGLDVERISHVVNFDIPTDTESYVHRIGRTGRAGRSGDAISFVTPRERHLLKAIEKATRQALTQMKLPTVEDINATRLTRFDDAITAALESDELDFFREVIAHYVKEYNVPEADVAAALAVVPAGRRADAARAGARAGPPARPWAAETSVRPGRATAATVRRPRRPRGRGGQRFGDVPHQRRQAPPGASRGRSSAHSPTRAASGRQDFGRIDIRADHSLVELPAELPAGRLAAAARHPHLGTPHRPEPRRAPQQVAQFRAVRPPRT